jgi:ABC-type Mn2+/Zn2+ transport system ATPase subunit
MAWVRYQFTHLAKLTQEALVKLNADFAIKIDESTDLEFTFQRLDEDSPVDLPMGKLSGGQRVRLCVAFLMAVQKRLVPEVGLLVLDEPSVHVDEAGVQSLADLLRDAAGELQNTEHQIWVVDHSPVIATALSKVKQLA